MQKTLEPCVHSEDRDSLIRWLVWNDSNGCYTDEHSDMEGKPRLTLKEAQDLFLQVYIDNGKE